MSAEEVLFHGQEVTLVRGDRIFVNPWGIKTGRRMMGRVKTILSLMKGATSGDLEGLLEGSYDELVAIAADSVGLQVTEFEDETRFTLEDLVAILQAVVDVNFVRRPEFVAKILGLFGTMEKMMAGEGASPKTPETTTSDSPQQ